MSHGEECCDLLRALCISTTVGSRRLSCGAHKEYLKSFGGETPWKTAIWKHKEEMGLVRSKDGECVQWHALVLAVLRFCCHIVKELF